MKKAYYICLLCFLTACSITKSLTPSQDDAARGAEQFDGLTLEDLQKGRSIYENQCQRCHDLAKPQALTEEQWRKVVPPMVKKVNKKTKAETISAEDEEILLEYLITMSGR